METEVVVISNRVRPVAREIIHRVATAMHDGDVVASQVGLDEVRAAVIEEYGFTNGELEEFMERLFSLVALQSLERHDYGDGWPRWCRRCSR